MQTSQDHENLSGSRRFYHQLSEELQTPSYNLDQFINYDNGSSQDVPLSFHTNEQQQCTIDSSVASGSYLVRNSPSSVSCSPNPNESFASPPDCLLDTSNSMYNTTTLSAVTGPCSVVGCRNDPEHKKVPKTAMQLMVLRPGSQFVGPAANQLLVEPEMSKSSLEMVQRDDLKHMLLVCAKAIADDDLLTSEWLLSRLHSMVSVSGEPLQRLGAYMLEGLVARMVSSGSSIYKSLRCKEPTSTELLSYMHLLYEACPYFKFGYLSANGAIAEAMKNETRIHIIDFQIAQGSQWIALIQALAAQPGGSPQLRITGIDDSFSSYARGGGIETVGKRLSKLAESCGVPFEFHGLAISCDEVDSKHLNVRPGEALAVNFALMLHHMPDESVGVQNHRDRLLRMVKSLSPKVVTLVEQESNTNTAPFFPRFSETLEYYLAVFESIDVSLPREHKERINVEQHCLARDIVNIIACEGPERVERHELLGKWRLRFAMAGFTPYPLSPFVNSAIKSLLNNYCEKYRLQERDGCLYLGWMNRDLVASCAWI